MKIEITQDLLDHIGKKLNCNIANYKILGHGEHNVNYTLETEIGKFVLRIYANNQLNTSKNEFEIMKNLNGRFSPKVFCLDTSKIFIAQHYMIQEFIEGKTLEKFDENNIRKVANLLKEVHKIKDSKKDRAWKFLISEWTKNNLLENSKFLDKNIHIRIKELYDEVLKKLEKIKPFMERYTRTSLTHDDTVPANFIEKNNGELILVDWELATFDYHLFDFGGVIAESHLSDKLEKIFLESYGFGLKKGERIIVQTIKINRILSLIGWLVERIAMIKQGVEVSVFDDNTNYEKRLEEELRYIRKLIDE